MDVWKIIFLFNWVIFRFHVIFRGQCSAKSVESLKDAYVSLGRNGLMIRIGIT